MLEDVIIEGNKVTSRYKLSRTHKGEFIGLQPSNKQFNVDGMTLFSFRNTKIVERWNLVDMVALMEQLKYRS